MQENVSDLARKYREEMLRMYGSRQSAEPVPEDPLPEPTPDAQEPPSLLPDPEPAEEMPEAVQEESSAFEEPVLPDYIRPDPLPLPAEWAAQEAYEKRNSAEGKLRVVAAAADSAFPVPGARVMVFINIGKQRILAYLLLTDENGETPTVTLPAPPASLSQESENQQPYASCDIEINAKSFFRSEALDVHIFAGITTRQEFQLVPLPLNMTSADIMELNPEGRSVDEEVE